MRRIRCLPTKSSGLPHSAEARVLTSTNTIYSSCSVTTSTSYPRNVQFLSMIRCPFDSRNFTAASSPFHPSLLCSAISLLVEIPHNRRKNTNLDANYFVLVKIFRFFVPAKGKRSFLIEPHYSLLREFQWLFNENKGI